MEAVAALRSRDIRLLVAGKGRTETYRTLEARLGLEGVRDVDSAATGRRAALRRRRRGGSAGPLRAVRERPSRGAGVRRPGAHERDDGRIRGRARRRERRRDGLARAVGHRARACGVFETAMRAGWRWRRGRPRSRSPMRRRSTGSSESTVSSRPDGASRPSKPGFSLINPDRGITLPSCPRRPLAVPPCSWIVMVVSSKRRGISITPAGYACCRDRPRRWPASIAAGVAAVMATNQAGIARDYFSEGDARGGQRRGRAPARATRARSSTLSTSAPIIRQPGSRRSASSASAGSPSPGSCSAPRRSWAWTCPAR